VRWAFVGALVLVAALTGGRGEAAPDDTPDAQMLLDLDVLTQPEAGDRDFIRRLSLFERLRMLELYRMFDDTPAAAARRPPGTPGVPPGAPASPPPGTPPPPPPDVTAPPATPPASDSSAVSPAPPAGKDR